MAYPDPNDLRALARARFEDRVAVLQWRTGILRAECAALMAEYAGEPLLEAAYTSLDDVCKDLRAVRDGDYQPEVYLPERGPDGGSI